MYGQLKEQLKEELSSIEEAGLFKKERVITSVQDAEITISTGEKVLNFCANNYLGLSSHPKVVEAAKKALDTHGFGMSSVRFICGTQDIHKELESKSLNFLERRIPSCMLLHLMPMVVCSNLFLNADDAIISDSLNHASIIDELGCVRLSDIVTRITIWPIWRNSLKQRPVRRIRLLSQTVFSRWMGMSHSWIKSVI